MKQFFSVVLFCFLVATAFSQSTNPSYSLFNPDLKLFTPSFTVPPPNFDLPKSKPLMTLDENLLLNPPPKQWGQLNGGGSFDFEGQGAGSVQYQHPDGFSGSLGYLNQRGYGKDLSVDAMVPIWKSKDDQTSLSAGGGLTQHFGGDMGSQTLEKRLAVGLEHKF